MAELERQLRYAPRKALVSQMDAAEELVADVDPVGTYPSDFVTWRITSYRPEAAGTMFSGSDVIADLAVFVQRLSERVDLRADDGPREALVLSSLARENSVSTRTVQRWRREGLVCHYVDHGDGPVLSCFRDAFDRFQSRGGGRVARAGTFARMDAGEVEAIVEAARSLAANGRSLNQAATALAEMHGRSIEAVRGVLKRHDAEAEQPLFAARGPLGPRDRRIAVRADRMGIPTTEVAARLQRSTAAVRRLVRESRRQRLRAWPLVFTELPTFELPDAESIILAAPPVHEALDELPDFADALAVISLSRETSAPTDDLLAALLGGMFILRRRVAERRDDAKSASALDALETDLRWASRLKRRLIATMLPVAIGRIDQFLHRPLETTPTETITRLLQLAVAIAGSAIETLDLAGGQHLERRVAYDLDRTLAGLADDAGRAASRHAPGSLDLAELLDEVDPWCTALDLERSLRVHLGAIAADDATLMRAHVGLLAGPPKPRAALAEELGTGAGTIDRRLSRARRALLAQRRAAN